MIKICISLFIAFFSLNAHCQKYSMEDLKVLETQNEFKEFFDHVKDIPPSRRDESWQEMLKNVAQAFLKSKAFLHNISTKDFKYLERIYRLNTLRNDEFFNSKYENIIINYHTECFTLKKSNCEQSLRSLLKRIPVSKSLGIKVSKLLYLQGIKSKLIDYVLPMANSELSEFYCGKKPTSNILIDHLFKDKNFHSLINKDCLKKLIPTLNKNLLMSNSPLLRNHTYKLLSKTNNLKTEFKEKYLIIQLLEAFNLEPKQTIESFSILKRLSKNSSRRERMVSFLKKQIPLYGKVFKMENKSAKAIIKGLTRNIPEYIDYYASTCLGHLDASLSTPGGNPATYCHEFFIKAQKLNFIPKAKIDRYKKIMKY